MFQNSISTSEMLILSKKSLLLILVAVFVGFEYDHVEEPSFVSYLEMNPIKFKLNEIAKKYSFKLVIITI